MKYFGVVTQTTWKVNSRVHKRNSKEGKGRGEFGVIAINQYLACRGQGGNGHLHPNYVEVFVKGNKPKRLLTV